MHMLPSKVLTDISIEHFYSTEDTPCITIGEAEQLGYVHSLSLKQRSKQWQPRHSTSSSIVLVSQKYGISSPVVQY